MDKREVQQFIKFVRTCEGWQVERITRSQSWRFRAPDGHLVFMHGTVNHRTLANRRALLERHGLPKRKQGQHKRQA